jgi:hypothetical protein
LNISKQDVIDRYRDGATTKSIAESAGCTPRYIRIVLRKAGENIERTRGITKYSVNERFFREWSPEMAYVLGFILTDGCVTGNTLSISQANDLILRKIKAAMESEHPVIARKNGSSRLFTLHIGRKSMVADLLALGITEKKSLTVGFPNVPRNYMPHFIRGVIDGDGWAHHKAYTMNVTSGSDPFSEGLRDVFESRELNTRITYQNQINRIWVSGKDDVNRLGRWIYRDCGDLFLPRKRERFAYQGELTA